MEYDDCCSVPTRISGDEPAWWAYRGPSSERSHAFARHVFETMAVTHRRHTDALRPELPAVDAGLRDTDAPGVTRPEVWSARAGIVLEQRFAPERRGTVAVVAEGNGE